MITGDDAVRSSVGNAHAPVRAHAKRLIRKKRGSDKARHTRVDAVPGDVRDLYRGLSDCRQVPCGARRRELSARFSGILERRTGYTDPGDRLWLLSRNRAGLLRVPTWDTPLHTNGAERDIRARVTRREIPFETRSGDGRIARDVCLGVAGAPDVSELTDLVRRPVPA